VVVRQHQHQPRQMRRQALIQVTEGRQRRQFQRTGSELARLFAPDAALQRRTVRELPHLFPLRVVAIKIQVVDGIPAR